MERILLEIVESLRTHSDVARLDDRAIQAIVRSHNGGLANNKDHYAKKQILPFYLNIKANDPARWAKWNIDEDLEKRLMATLQVKPRRTASGVATITVITKPAPCANACLYCPNDVRMPKSYLRDEPACQRAERNFFDPYLQVVSRARALHEMGHNISKLEIIVLGGTWCDYPKEYQRWFAAELFRAANNLPAELAEAERHARFFNAISAGVTDATGATGTTPAADAPAAPGTTPAATDTTNATGAPAASGATPVTDTTTQTPSPTASLAPNTSTSDMPHNAAARRAFYERCGLTSSPQELEAQTATLQAQVSQGQTTYNQAASILYKESTPWRQAALFQTATPEELESAQQDNVTAAHRIVGFVVETRPDTITPNRLALLRSLGCTKVQMGIQSLDPQILKANNRPTSPERVKRALSLARLFGFKLHTHFMVNLAGATPASDKAEYRTFVTDPAYLPDEVKLYPCALVDGTGLVDLYERGKWRPYSEEELLDILVADVLETPDYCRISRMIRDISAGDILVGNKKTNLRQMVEQRIRKFSENTPRENTPGENAPGQSAPSENAADMDTPCKSVPSENAPVVREIRYREISTQTIDLETLELQDKTYETSVSTEHFLQWVTPDNLIAGFLRLSLPHADELEALHNELIEDASPTALRAAKAIAPGHAMIREVHVYGRVANLGASVDGAQHTGLGRGLIAYAEKLTREAGYSALNVISAVGTREYYRALGFDEVGLYQQKRMMIDPTLPSSD